MLRLALIFVALCLLALKSWAGEIALILADDSPPYREFASSLQKNLKAGWRINYTDNDLRPLDRFPVDLVITAGTEALRKTLGKAQKTPVLATLLPENAYQGIILDARSPPPVSAIYLDQPARRQARLLRLLFPDSQRIGMLVSEQSRAQANAFRQPLTSQRLQLITEAVNDEAHILPALETLLPRTDALLALPDPLIYSRNTIKPLLITAYRFRRPVVAFSAALVKAGALAGLYSTPAQIGRQAGEQVSTHGNRLPPPGGPVEFSLSINQSVADAFGLRLPEEADLFQKLLSGGTEQ
jgi:ABC-type uncharacterized transport system substrate-binding protein